MKRRLRTAMLCIGLIFAISPHLLATHIMGVDITYECLGNCTYRIHWRAYRDCNGVTNISPALNFIDISGTGCAAPVALNNWSAQNTIEVTPICPGIPTRCTDPTASINGVEEYYRFRDFDICSSNCIYRVTWGDCCRNNAITSGAASDQIYTWTTTINTGIPCNSSPQFNNPPVPYICLGQAFTFNQGAFDPDGDSLEYSLGPCYDTDSLTLIGYTGGAGFTPTTPLGPSWNVNLNSQTGDISITPQPGNLEVGVLCIYVDEYRNGVLIGTVVRDMQITVIDCGNNIVPTTTGVSNVTGGTGSGFNVSTCFGNTLSFDIPVVDPDVGQNVTFWWDQNINGATFVQTGGGTSDTIIGPNPSGTFNWTPPAVGVYTFLVSMQDDNCPITGRNQFTFTIMVNPAITVNATASALCDQGSFNATVTGGSAPFSYTWSGTGGFTGSGPSTTFTYPGPGNYLYAVTVTDASGCTDTYSGSVLVPGAPTLTTSFTSVSCNGGNDGTLTVSANGGTAPYTYSWNTTPQQTTATATNVSAGNYTATVTDATGCTSTAAVILTEPSALSTTMSATDATCNGSQDGTATVLAAGGTAPYSYAWSTTPVQTTATATGLGASGYTVTVTDANGCILSDGVTVSDPPEITLLTLPTPPTCNGGSNGTAEVQSLGGTPPYSYSWNTSPVQTTPIATGLNAGTYTVTVTDANACIGTSTATVAEPTALTGNTSQTDVTCNTGADGTATVTASGGVPPYSFAWNTAPVQTAATASGLTAGNWSVTITDNNGCTEIKTVTIAEPTALTLAVTSTDVTCNGAQDGTATATVTGGTAPYSYSWTTNPTQTSAAATGLSGGSYTVVVTDAQGCSLSGAVTIAEPTALSLSVSGTDPTCSGGNNGDATATLTGGTAPYSFVWNTTPAQTAATAINLGAGTWQVIASDANGCSLTDTITLVEASAINLLSTVTDVSCNGGSDGTATVFPSGGTPPFTYLWNTTPAQTTALISNLSPGNYGVTVQDANGCTESLTMTVGEPSSIAISFNSSPISCFGGSDGSISANASGGVGPYVYSWSTTPAQTTSTATGLVAGTYTLTLTDANGCTQSATTTLGEPPALAVSVSGPGFVCAGGQANLSATATGGTPGYGYNWSSNPAGFTSAQATISVGPDQETVYQITVTDQNGCVTAVDHTVEVKPAPVADFDAGPLEGCDSLEVFFQNNSLNGFQYLWRFGDGTTSTEENPSHVYGPGVFDVTLIVTSPDGCTDSTTQSGLVHVLPSPIAAFTTLEDLSQGISVSNAIIHFQNQSQFATNYFWEFGDGAVSGDVHPVHQYTTDGLVDVTLYAYNDFGCVDSVSLNGIEILIDGQIFNPNAFSPNGDGINESFQLKGEGVKDYLLLIFDRWGREIFQSTSIHHSWDGTFKGQSVQEGVYVWKLEAGFNSGARVERGGTVTLIR